MTKFMVEQVDSFSKRKLAKRYVCVYIDASYIAVSRETVSEEVLLFISDGLQGIVDAIKQVYPRAKYQVCSMHVARNIAHKVRAIVSNLEGD